MERDFEYLVGKYGEAGAREIFEKICVNLFQCLYGPKSKTVKPSQGDGGLDVLVGDLPKTEKVYQCKFFLKKIGDSQKQQIRESFKTVTEKYDVSEWYLCLPTILTEKELLWWSKWKNDRESETGIKIELCDGSYLINNLKKHDLYTEIFDDDIRTQLDLILAELIIQRQKIMEEILYGIDDIGNLDEEYNDFIFVKMLESANITEINDRKIEFFNAEISRQESISKDEVAGLRVYNNLKSKIFSLWQTQYREHKHPSDGNNLLNKMYLRVEDLESTTLASTSEYTLLSKKGILHHLANDKKIGWIEDYLTKLTEYMGNAE
ncbi:MAG: ABC-three component system protein [Enterococcus avium]